MTGCCQRQSAGVTVTKMPVNPSCFILESMKQKASQVQGPEMRAIFINGADGGAFAIFGGGDFAPAAVLAITMESDGAAESCFETHCMLRDCGAYRGKKP